MRVLVTGGSGVIGSGLLPALIRRGHQVRLLARGAEAAASQWPDDVEAFAGDVTQPETLEGASDDCDAVVHISGIVAETPPAATFERVNVEGTRNLLVEAERAGTPRFVYVSSLGADRGTSAYHASKRKAEALVQEYPGSWVIVRPGAVYGPGDEVISQLLQMQRSLPVVPVIGMGDHRFQPIFYADAGEALAVAAEREDVEGAFEIGGAEVTTPSEVLAILSEITGRPMVPVHVPETVAEFAARAAEAAGLPFPIDESKIRMLLESNVIDPPSANALTTVCGVDPTPLRQGLQFLADLQPEQQPAEGVGGLERKCFWAAIRGTDADAEGLMTLVRGRCTEIMPVEFEAEPGAATEIEEGATLTAAIPMRGNIQVRVTEVTPDSFTFVTLRGHPLAGIVRFAAEDLDDGAVKFSVTIWARAATLFDWFAMNTVGRFMQDDSWRTVVSRAVVLSGGMADAIHAEAEVCDPQTASEVQRQVETLVAVRKRQERSA